MQIQAFPEEFCMFWECHSIPQTPVVVGIEGTME
jgi:hypothetical protein